jgi:hypothetical protein
MPAGLFARLDADKSGGLSQAELGKAHFGRGGKGGRGARRGSLVGSGTANLGRLPGDADHDGVVTQAEATAGVQKLVASSTSIRTASSRRTSRTRSLPPGASRPRGLSVAGDDGSVSPGDSAR